MLEDVEEDKQHGVQMVLDQYLKSMSTKDKTKKDGSNLMLDLGDNLALGLLKMGAEKKGKSNGLLSAAMEWWPTIQRPFAKDPIDDAIKTEGLRGKEIKDIPLP